MERSIGNYPDALANYLSALKIYQEMDDKEGIADAYNVLGVIYSIQENYSEALRNYQASLKISYEIGDKRDIAGSTENIGSIYYEQGNSETALEYYLESAKIREEIGHKRGLAHIYGNIGRIYHQQGNYTEAEKNYLNALRIDEEIGNNEGIPEDKIQLGNFYIDLGDYKQARSYLDDALVILQGMRRKGDIINCYGDLSRLDSAEGNFEQSLMHYKLYTLYKDSVYNEENSNQLLELQTRFETEKKDQEIELLNKDNSIKALQLEEQEASLRASALESEKNRNELLLLNTSKELQQLQLARTQEELENQHLLSDAQAAEMALVSKDKELKQQQRNGAIIGMAVLLIIGFLLFRSFYLRKRFERQQAVAKERERISADLHDDIGSGISKLILMLEVLSKEIESPEAKMKAKAVSEESLELSKNMSEVIWALNSRNDFLESLITYIRRYAGDYFENSRIRFKMTTPAQMPGMPLSSEYRRNIFYAVKEALHNIVKHSQATEAEVSATLKDQVLTIMIRDNGIGMPEGELNRFGNGIIHMRNRMESIGGKFGIESSGGTRVTLSLPV